MCIMLADSTEFITGKTLVHDFMGKDWITRLKATSVMQIKDCGMKDKSINLRC